MNDPLTKLRANVGKARDLTGLANTLSAQLTQAFDTSDILRASLVLAVSALDHFVHEVVREGMLEIAASKRASTEAYLRFKVSLRGLANVSATMGAFRDLRWLDDQIRENHGWLSFQDPAKIADAMRIVTDKPLWREVGLRMGLSEIDVKSQLKLIVDRRNKIAHEADMDPTVPGVRWPIDATVTMGAINFLERIAETILEVTKN